jgi:hypothetical protein
VNRNRAGVPAAENGNFSQGFCVLVLRTPCERAFGRQSMSGLIYLIGLIVVILAILSFFGLR